MFETANQSTFAESLQPSEVARKSLCGRGQILAGRGFLSQIGRGSNLT